MGWGEIVSEGICEIPEERCVLRHPEGSEQDIG